MWRIGDEGGLGEILFLLGRRNGDMVGGGSGWGGSWLV